MPVVEYMLHKVARRGAQAPHWVEDGGHHHSPIDGTKVGWVVPASEREYYVPDTVVELSKQDFIDRQLAIHAEHPSMKIPNEEGADPVEMTTEEVAAQAGEWYDYFVAENSGGE